ncbi:MAG: C4-dicarboxylate ABC transporter substrate-binding protein [Desulfurococcales archaeon ex4484_204]|nr:MAG: C4-dicarboxylate ABC transporter substrate-binding protein [Desulfurococcales archaeon ex4484_204]
MNTREKALVAVAIILLVIGIAAGYGIGSSAAPVKTVTKTATVTTTVGKAAATVTVTRTVTAAGGKPTGKTYKFKIFTVFGKGDPYFNDIKYFVSLVKNLTNGAVVFEPYSCPELGIKLAEQLRALKAGTSEFGLVSPAFLPEDPVFPLMSSKPGPLSDVYDLYYYIKEEEDIIVKTFNKFGVVYVGPMYYRPETVAFRVPVHSIADMKGKIIRSAGLAATFYKLLGLESVVMPGGELYTALQTGSVDALEWTDWSSHYVNGFYELAKYVFEPVRGVNFHSEAYPMYLCANPDVWNSLPEDYKRAIRAAIYLTFFHAGYRQDKAYQYYKQKCIKAGNVALKLPEEDFKKIIEAGVQVYIIMAKKSPTCLEYVKRHIHIWRDLGYVEWANALEQAMKKNGLI